MSQGVSDGLASAVEVPREKITTIYNGVVTPDLHAKAAEQPDHLWFRDNLGGPVMLDGDGGIGVGRVRYSEMLASSPEAGRGGSPSRC